MATTNPAHNQGSPEQFVPTEANPAQPLNIWSNESFQDIRSIMQNLGDHFNKGDGKEHLPTLDFDPLQHKAPEHLRKPEDLAQDLFKEGLKPDSETGRALSEMISNASSHGEAAVNELLENLNSALEPHGRHIKLREPMPHRRPAAEYIATLVNDRNNQPMGSVVAEGRGRK
ncbi:MAG: hypothetical protein KC652_25370 [Cyanobacteria bacterium HKST-UBA01]|nr:hypothetical protein [Cyanobacteria bacterium HKST-UBA01]